MESTLPVVVDEILEGELVESSDNPLSSTGPKGIDLAHLQMLITIKGLNQTDTAQVLGISQQAVSEHVRRHNIVTPARLKEFQDNLVSVLLLRRFKFNQELSGRDLKKESIYQMIGEDAITAGLLTDAESKAPDMIDHSSLVASTEDAKQAYDQARDARLLAQESDAN